MVKLYTNYDDSYDEKAVWLQILSEQLALIAEQILIRTEPAEFPIIVPEKIDFTFRKSKPHDERTCA